MKSTTGIDGMLQLDQAGTVASPTDVVGFTAGLRGGTLVELEFGEPDGTVVELQVEVAAGAAPGCLGLPDVDVLAGRAVVGQAAATGGVSGFDRVERCFSVAVDKLRGRVAGSEYVQAV